MVALFVHKLLDAFIGAPGAECKAMVRPDKTPEITKDRADAVIEAITQAEKFDFGQLHLEPANETGKYCLPDITQPEYEAWAEGLIPLPAPVCWFEFTLGKSRSGLLIVETVNDDKHLWSCQQFDWSAPNPVIMSGIWVSLDLNDPGTAEAYKLIIHGNNVSRDEQVQILGVHNMRENYAYQAPLAIYMALMINSRSTDIKTEIAPEKLNKLRKQRGKVPLYTHRVVRIIPDAYIREQRTAQGLSDRLPPRMHWRRSHIRVLHRGEPGERRIIIARMLVAKASEAEVTHEYVVGS